MFCLASLIPFLTLRLISLRRVFHYAISSYFTRHGQLLMCHFSDLLCGLSLSLKVLTFLYSSHLARNKCFSPVFRFAPFTNRKTHFNLHFPHLPKIFKHDSANYEQLCYIFITDILFFMSINITRFNLPKSLIYKMGNWKHLSVFLHITQPFVSQQPKQAQQKLETHYISALMTDWCSLHIEIIMMSKS